MSDDARTAHVPIFDRITVLYLLHGDAVLAWFYHPNPEAISDKHDELDRMIAGPDWQTPGCRVVEVTYRAEKPS